jgi:hypothetical protein
MGQANRSRDQFVENCGLQLQSEEIRIIGIKCGIEIFLDGCQVDAIIFHSRVVALDQDGEHSEPQKQDQGFGRQMVFHACILKESRYRRMHGKLRHGKRTHGT